MTRSLISLVFFGLVVGLVYAVEPIYIDGRGHPQAKRQGKTQVVKQIEDTLRLKNGFAKMVLSTAFRNNLRRSAPTSQANIYPVVSPLLTDTGASIFSYGVVISKNGETLTVKSSSVTDSSKVILRAMIK